MAFSEACQKAWTFFNNALSVHTELVYIQTSLVAIQAITVMVSKPDPGSLGQREICSVIIWLIHSIRLGILHRLHWEPMSRVHVVHGGIEVGMLQRLAPPGRLQLGHQPPGRMLSKPDILGVVLPRKEFVCSLGAALGESTLFNFFSNPKFKYTSCSFVFPTDS